MKPLNPPSAAPTLVAIVSLEAGPRLFWTGIASEEDRQRLFLSMARSGSLAKLAGFLQDLNEQVTEEVDAT